jgi:hypothetical protein
MTAFGPIAGAIVGVLLDRWLKKDRCNSLSDLELGLSSALKKVDSMRGRLDNLETSFGAIQAVQADPKPGEEKNEPAESSGAGLGAHKST